MPPTRRPSKSKYTADRGIPGAFEGETVTRRRFMTGTVHGAGALMTMGIALPALAFAIGPIFDNVSLPWQPVGPPDIFPDDNYIPAIITTAPGVGEAGKSTVYIRARNPTIDTTPPNQYNRWVAITNRVRAPRLPGALGARRGAFHLPLPRRRLRPPGRPRRRPATAPARPLLHAPQHDTGLVEVGRALQRQQRAADLLAARPGRAARRHRPVPLPSRPSVRAL